MSGPVATVRVRLVVEVKTGGSWGADCTLGQIQKQGVEAATNIVQRQLTAAGIRIVGVVATDLVVNCEEIAMTPPDATGTKKKPDVRFNPIVWGVYEVVQRADGKVLGRAIREAETNWTAVLYTGAQSLGHRSRTAAAEFLWSNTGELEAKP